MALTNEDGGGIPGTTGSVCTSSPNDQALINNNLISRVGDIEKFLSRLVGADVNANNLSELATNIGNILNGTIVLPGDGYSPYGPGGSIPVPDDFSGTVISGNVITIWTNGVVSYELINGSQTVGGGGVSKFAQVTILAGGGAITAVNILVDADNLVDVSSPTITINETGLYLFTLLDSIGVNTTNAQNSILQLAAVIADVPGTTNIAQAGYATSGSTSGTKAARIGSGVVTTILNAGAVLTASLSQTGGTWTHTGTLSIVKLGSL